MFSLLAGMAFVTAAEVQSAPVAPSVASATQWVRLIDGQEWAQSWTAAGRMFKSQMSQGRWAETIQPVRKPLGSVKSRTLKSVTATTSLPGAPTGEYQVVQFQTSFSNKPNAVETVVLAREPDGWKVNGYFIR